jgi:hypothetical protein
LLNGSVQLIRTGESVLFSGAVQLIRTGESLAQWFSAVDQDR